MKRLLFVAAAVALCLTFAAQSQAGAVTDPAYGVYNTGVDNAGNVLPDGTVGDPHYSLITVPSGSQTILVRSATGFPIPPWAGPDSLSAWIGPNNAYDLSGPDGYYTYETMFTTPNVPNLSRLEIIGGEESADNQRAGIYLNGNLVANSDTSTGSSTSQFLRYYPFAITSGFAPVGQTNKLDFVVYNYPGPSNNPTGLRVEMTASTSRGVIPGLYDTGVGNSGSVLPDGVSGGDPHYALVSVPPGSTTNTRVRTSAGGYPIPPYIGDDSISAWIGPDNANDLTGPDGYYDYQTTFNLTGFVPRSASINGGLSGGWSTDNQRYEILLNGHLVVGPISDPNIQQFEDFYPFSISGSPYFTTGTNTLDFIVYNYPGGSDNPTALRVEMVGTANYIPEPLSMIFFGTGIVAVLGYVSRRKMLRQG